MQVQLTVMRGDRKGQEILVGVPAFRIGGAEDCDLCLRSPDVSQQHCIIYVHEGTVAVLDLGSKEGTYVNGSRISTRKVLRDGDELTVGAHSFSVALVAALDEEEPKDEIMFEVRVRKQNISVTKSRLFKLAQTGELLPDDVITVAGTKIFADSIEGIVFGNKSSGTSAAASPDDSAAKKSGWFYHDAIGEKIGPLTSKDLKKLVKQGIITAETLVENPEGKSVFAAKVKGLITHSPELPARAAEKSPDVSPLDAASTDSSVQKTSWFFYNESGKKIGPFTNRQLKDFAKQGIIMPETRIENARGQSTLAKNATGLRFLSPAGTAAAVPTPQDRAVPDIEGSIESPFGIDGEPVVMVARTPLVRVSQKRGVIGEIGEKLDGPFRQGYATLRENFARHRVKVISGVAVVICLLGFSWVFAYFWWGNPHGTVNISGTLTLDGNPVAGASVIFRPRSESGISAGGTTDARGRFTVTSRIGGEVARGVKEGEYDITFSKVKMEESLPSTNERAGNVQSEVVYEIPQKYEDPQTSGLAPIRVEARGEKNFVFELSSEPSRTFGSSPPQGEASAPTFGTSRQQQQQPFIRPQPSSRVPPSSAP